MSGNKGLLIFIKNPVLGTVKTRLAKDIGNEKALNVYIQLLHHTNNVALSVDCHRYLFYSDKIEFGDIWDPKHFEKNLQHGGDLGSRIKEAFRLTFNKTEYNVIIGSDCLDLNPDHIQVAFHNLQFKDLVIGPAKDGGYYLLGIKKYVPSLFEGVKWSSSSVLADTLQVADKLGLNYHLLPELSDIDRLEDLNKYKL